MNANLLWPGTFSFTEWLVQHPQSIEGMRIIELGRLRLARNRRTGNRPYGGMLSGAAVRERKIRAFLIEEQKIVKKVLKIQKTKEKQAAKK